MMISAYILTISRVASLCGTTTSRISGLMDESMVRVIVFDEDMDFSRKVGAFVLGGKRKTKSEPRRTWSSAQQFALTTVFRNQVQRNVQ